MRLIASFGLLLALAACDIAGVALLDSPADLNGKTNKEANVTAAQIADTAISGFTVATTGAITAIDTSAGTVSINVPTGTDVTKLTPTITLATGATVVPATGVQQDFTSPVTYTVTAKDKTTKKTYTVTVTPAAVLLSYTLADAKSVSITGTAVSVVLNEGTDIKNQVATFTLSPGATAKVGSVVQATGTTNNDYSNTQTFAVVASDASTKDYQVSVSVYGPKFIGLYFLNANKANAYRFDFSTTSLASLGQTDTYNALTSLVIAANGSYAAATGPAMLPLALNISNLTGALTASSGSITYNSSSSAPDAFGFDALGTRLLTKATGTWPANFFDMFTTSGSAPWTRAAQTTILNDHVDGIAVAPSGNYIFVADASAPTNMAAQWGSVYALAVNGAGVFSTKLGSNAPFKGVTLSMGPKYLAVDPKERFVFAAPQSAMPDSSLNVYTVAASGLTWKQNFQVASGNVSFPPGTNTPNTPLDTQPFVTDASGKWLTVTGDYSAHNDYKALLYSVTDSGVNPAAVATIDLVNHRPWAISFNKTGTKLFIVSSTVTPNLTWYVDRYDVHADGTVSSATNLVTRLQSMMNRPVVDPAGNYIFAFTASSTFPDQLTVFSATGGGVIGSPQGLSSTVMSNTELYVAPIYP